eukprot:Nk52_evm7s158 gene=Nk52_evmTU7s158
MSSNKFDFTDDQISEITEAFAEFDLSNKGSIAVDDLGQCLANVGHTVPGYKLRRMVEEASINPNGDVTKDQFMDLLSDLKYASNPGYKKVVKQSKGVNQMAGTSSQSAEGTTHSFSDDEKMGYVDWINSQLGGDPDLSKVLPMKEEGNHLFSSLHDGVLLCKLINASVPDTIDERAINMKKLNVYNIHENQTLVLNSSKAIGCTVVNVGAQDLMDGNPHLCLGLIWQVIRIGLFARITLQNCPGLPRLLEGDETLEELLALPPDSILLRWFNFHLREAGVNRTITNFSGDIKDSEGYTYLLKQIAPANCKVGLEPLQKSDPMARAQAVLENAEKMDCRKFVKPRDIVKGNARLNLAFTAHLFNTFPALELLETDEEPEEIIEETREEKTFRNWMNSLGVEPFVNNLYMDLRDGIVLIQLFDKVKPGCVDWKQVNKPPYKKISGMMKKLENCNYALALAKDFKFSLVGIDGKDIFDGNKTLTLAVVWQLMRAYTLSVLSSLSSSNKPVEDSDILAWANETLSNAGKASHISSFKDQTISTSLPVIELIDAIRPGAITQSNVLPGRTPKDKLLNAKYAVSMARKIGAGVYALPEDLVEVKPKMVLTVFACLMACSFNQPK